MALDVFTQKDGKIIEKGAMCKMALKKGYSNHSGIDFPG